MCDDIIDLRPLRNHVVGVPIGTNATFTVDVVQDGSDLDISGDTFEAFVYADGIEYEGVASITGGAVFCDWTGTQTTNMGVGVHKWKLVWHRDGRSFNLIQANFQVIDNAE